MVRSTRLFDLADDATEMKNVADRVENREVVERLLAVLPDHLRRTDHDPDTISIAGGVRAILVQFLLPEVYRR
jgi:hypothetical protein